MNLTKMIWTQPKRFGHDQNNWYSSKIIWMVQNHYGSIEGQGISVLLKKAISQSLKLVCFVRCETNGDKSIVTSISNEERRSSIIHGLIKKIVHG